MSRPRIIRPCHRCGTELSAREMQIHRCDPELARAFMDSRTAEMQKKSDGKPAAVLFPPATQCAPQPEDDPWDI